MSKKQSKRPQRHWRYDASSAKPATTPLLPADAEEPKAPMVIYTTEVYHQVCWLVRQAKAEVGWWGLVDVTDDGDYLITEIFVPKQEVTGVTTDIEAEAMTELALELMDRNLDPGKLYYYGHSHVNMGVSPSMQDEENTDQYLADCPIFIREIRNKKGDVKVDVFDTNAGVVYQCVDVFAEHDLIPIETQRWVDALLKANVTEIRFTNPVIKNTPPSGKKPDLQLFNNDWSYGGYGDLKHITDETWDDDSDSPYLEMPTWRS